MTRSVLWKALFALSAGANVALGAAVVLHATRGGEAAASAPSDSVPCLLSTLGLDAGQHAIIDRLRAAFETAHEARRAEMKAARERLFQAIAGSPGDRAGVETLLGRLGDAQLAMRRELVDHLLGVTAVLRPDQRAKFLDGIHRRFVEGGRHGEGEGAGESCGAAGGGGAGGQP